MSGHSHSHFAQKSEIGAVVVGGVPLKADTEEPILVGATVEKIGINTLESIDL